MRQLKIAQRITERGEILGKYFNEISRSKPLSIDEEVALAREIRKGGPKANEAINRLVTSNLLFVVSVAKQYQGRGLTLEDLISEGNIGMITAAKRFDETRGVKFISYAVWWIRQSILSALSTQARTVRMPSNRDGLASKVQQASDRFEQENLRRPSSAELESTLGVSAEKIAQANSPMSRTVSLDQPFGDDDEGNMLDVLPNEGPSVDFALERESLSIELDRVLDTLTPRERDIVKMSFGIGQQACTLEEIGYKYNLSTERIRQIKDRAIRRLRSLNDPNLRTYLS